MAYFCTDTGIRLVAPGTHATVPAFDDALPHHHEAEQAAGSVLADNPSGPLAPPSEALLAAARKAALVVVEDGPRPDPKSMYVGSQAEWEAMGMPAAHVEPKETPKASDAPTLTRPPKGKN